MSTETPIPALYDRRGVIREAFGELHELRRYRELVQHMVTTLYCFRAAGWPT